MGGLQKRRLRLRRLGTGGLGTELPLTSEQAVVRNKHKYSHAQMSSECTVFILSGLIILLLKSRSLFCHASCKKYTSDISRQCSFLHFYVFPVTALGGFGCARGSTNVHSTSKLTTSHAEYSGKP